MSIILPIEVSTTDTSKMHSIKALLDSRATGNFIDRDFIRMKGINTQSISHPIPVYNVDSSPNEAGVRATGVKDSRRFLRLNYAVEYVTTHLQEIPQRIR